MPDRTEYPYAITTDTQSDMPLEFYEKYDIKRGAGVLTFGEESYLDDRIDLPIEDFYRKMKSGIMPTTAQVIPAEHIRIWEPSLASGKDILHVTFSNQLSGTYNCAHMARTELLVKYPGREILIVDSLNASTGEGMLVAFAAENRDAGMTLADNAAWLEANRLKIKVLVTVNDLHHLHRGGRLSKTSAIAGSIVGIKPIITVTDEGRMEVEEKARGFKGAWQYMLGKVEELCPDTKKGPIYIGHSSAEEDAMELHGMLKERFGTENTIIFCIGPVIAAHIGLGGIGIIFPAVHR